MLFIKSTCKRCKKTNRVSSDGCLGLKLGKAFALYFCLSGQFEVVSPTVNHYRGGMRANYTVERCGFFQRQNEIMFHSKTYYIAAMETDWDYSPNRTWETEMYRGQERYRTTCTCTAYIESWKPELEFSISHLFLFKTRLSLSCCSPASVFLDQQGGFIGSRYKKVVYRQFTNDKFTKQMARTADMEHLGIMGRLLGQQKKP